MVGCTATHTLGAARRAAFAAELGADAVQVALPFWMAVDDREVVPFFRQVAAAAGGLPLSIYDTARSKKPLSVDQHRAIHDAVPSYLMVKATGSTVGTTVEGCRALSRLVNVFVSEHQWVELGPVGAVGSCSAMVYWNPRLILGLWEGLRQQDWEGVSAVCRQLGALHGFLVAAFAPKGFTDTAYDRVGGRLAGFLGTSLRCRAPYPSPTEADVAALRAWCRDHFPEMLRR